MPADRVAFEVEGRACPQGSKTAVQSGGRARVIEGGSSSGRKAHAVWRAAVTDAARSAYTGYLETPLDGPLEVALTFRFPIPQTRARRLADSGWGWSAVRPDLDKLCRAVLDSLTDSGLIRDDSRVVKLTACKVEVDSWHGVEVTVGPCTGDWT